MIHGNSGTFNFTHMYIHPCILQLEWIFVCDAGYTCMVRVLAAMLWHWSLFLVMITLVTLPSQIRNSHSGDRFSLRSQPHDAMQDVAYIISIYRPQLIKMYVAMYISFFAGYGCVCFCWLKLKVNQQNAKASKRKRKRRSQQPCLLTGRHSPGIHFV